MWWWVFPYRNSNPWMPVSEGLLCLVLLVWRSILANTFSTPFLAMSIKMQHFICSVWLTTPVAVAYFVYAHVHAFQLLLVFVCKTSALGILTLYSWFAGIFPIWLKRLCCVHDLLLSGLAWLLHNRAWPLMSWSATQWYDPITCVLHKLPEYMTGGSISLCTQTQ